MRLNNVRSGCLQTYKTALPLQKSWSHVRVCSSNQNLLQLSSKQPSLRVLAHGSAYVSGLGGNGGGNGNNTNQVTRIGDGDSGSSWGRSGALQVLQRLLQALAGWLLFVFMGSGISDFIHLRGPRLDTSKWTLSIIIPALNEERCIGVLLLQLRAMYAPEELEIIVVDGGSTDRTVLEARKGGASQVLKSTQRGRAAQMNVGAAAASGDILVFMHADTLKPPHNLPQVLRRVLSEPRTVLVGMRTLIRGTSKQDSSSSKNTGSAHSNQEDQATLCLGAKSIALQQREQQPQPQAASSTSGPLLKFMTFHHMIKTCAYPLLVQPVWYIQGFRLLFGDQVLCCRRADFHSNSIKGYKSSLPIMEDADLCIRMHKTGPSQACGLGYGGHGRVRQLSECVVETSGRRLEEWGNMYGTWVLFRIAIAWYCGASGDQLGDLYKKLYTDAFR